MKYAEIALIMVVAGGSEQALADPGPPINLVSNSNSNFTPKAVPDAVWGLTDCVVSGGTAIVYCPAPAAFSIVTSSGAAHAMLIADDVGSGRTPLVAQITSVGNAAGTTISGVTLSNGILLTLNSASTYPNAVSIVSGGHVTPLSNHVPGVSVTSAGSGYNFNSTQIMACNASCTSGDGRIPTSGTPALMTETGTAIISGAGGTGGTSGACSSLTATTEIGINGGVIVLGGSITTGGSLVGPLTVISSGMVTADNGTYTSANGRFTEVFSGCGFTSLDGPAIQFKYGIVTEQIKNPGSGLPGAGLYATAAPCVSSSIAMTSSSDGGTGLTVSCGGTLSYPGTVSFGTDNTSAFQAALGARGVTSGGSMNSAAANGSPECLYLPAGNYLTEPLNQYAGGTFPTNGNNIAQGYGCWLGDEHYHSNVFVIPNIQGDVFAWIDCNQNSSIVSLGNTQTINNFGTVVGAGTANQAGASFRNITILGDRLSTQQQNGLVFYGPTQFAYIDNIVVDYLPGHGFYGGALDAATGGGGEFTESIVQNARFEDDGGNAPTSIPTFEITASGTSEGSNTDSLTNIRIYQSIGPAFWLHSAGMSNTRFFRMTNVFLEGSAVSSIVNGGDLMLLGDPAQAMLGSNVSDIVGRNIQLSNPVLNFAALRVTGAGGSSLAQKAAQAANIDIDGLINSAGANAPGRGLQVEVCTHCSFKFADNNTQDYNLVIGARVPPLPCTNSAIGSPAATGEPGVTYDGELGYLGTSIKPSQFIAACLDPAAPSIGIPQIGTYN